MKKIKKRVGWMSRSKADASKLVPGPCAEEAEASKTCMEEGGGVKAKCLDKFQAYRNCKDAIFAKKQQDRNDVFWGRK